MADISKITDLSGTTYGLKDSNAIRLDGASYKLQPVSDLNNFLTGVGAFVGTQTTNAPDSGWWLVIAAGDSGTNVQVAFDLWNQKAPKRRYCASSAWSAWSDLYEPFLPLTGGTVTGALTLSGGQLVLNSNIYGSSLPTTSLTTGRVFFLTS